MSRRTPLGVWLASVAIACGIGLTLLVVLGSEAGRRWWIAGTALSAGWLYVNVAAREPGWAKTAAPAGVVNVFALLYLLDHGWTPIAAAMVGTASILSAVHVYRHRRHLRGA